MPERFLPYLFVLLWSSSFVAVKTGLRDMTPLLFVALRLTIAAAVLLAIMARRSWAPLSGRRWLHCGIAGILLNGIGLMPPHVGMEMAPAAHIALVQSLTPVLTALAGALWLSERLIPRQWAGLLLGVLGVGLVVGHAALESAVHLGGLGLGFAGVLGLSSGTLWFRRHCRDVPFIQATAMQMFAAAPISIAATLLFETPHLHVTATAAWSLTWNTVMVTLGGMAVYAFMLARGTAARVSANFYLVPGTASLFAWAFLNEALSLLSVAGLVVASIGCWLVSARD